MKIDPKTLSIDELLRDSILTVIFLREGSPIEQGDDLYKTCKQQVIHLREQLTAAQYSKVVVDDISYALCALLDETVLLYSKDKAKNNGYDLWQGAPLQVAFFKTNNAGTELFERIRQRLGEAKPSPIVLACFDRIIGMGFQGYYLGREQTEREQLAIELREATTNSVADMSQPIIKKMGNNRYFWRKSSLFFWTGMSVVIAIAIYWWLGKELNNLLTQLLPGV